VRIREREREGEREREKEKVCVYGTAGDVVFVHYEHVLFHHHESVLRGAIV